MKKIFAIALAVVMVLSMASAFALNDCSATNFDWSCSTDPSNCGKGAVEVVPYVKVNSACDGWTFQVSDCASAINTDAVHYAIKVTVEENADIDWWYRAALTFEVDGVAKAAELTDVKGDGVLMNALAIAEDKDAKVMYYVGNGAFVDAEDVEDIKSVVWTAAVTEADSAEVCAKLASEHSGLGTWTWGDYTVVVAADGVQVFKGTNNENWFYMTIESEKVTNMGASSAAFLAEVQGKFNLAGCVIGTCINADNLQKNFGWDFEQKDCFGWSDKGASVVDTDCVVAIPKTGDASVLAWLF